MSRVPFFVVLGVAILMLPYDRGAHGLDRDDVIIELNAAEAQAVCAFALGEGGGERAACESEKWRMIAIGKDKAVLVSLRDGKTYVVPVAAVQTYRILRRKTP